MARRFLLIIAVLFLIAACSQEPKKDEKKAAAPSAGEVVNKYVDTLATARPKAEKAVKAADKRTAEQEKIMKEMEK